MSTETMYDTTLESQAGSPASSAFAEKVPLGTEQIFHTTATIGQDQFTIIFDPRNITPEEEDAMASLDRQIEGLNRVMGNRGRTDFTDRRQLSRALGQRLAVLGQITEREIQIFTDPVGDNPTINNGLNRPPDEVPAPASKKDNSSHTIFPAVNAMVAASLFGQPFIHDGVQQNTHQEIVQHAQSQTVAGLVGKFDASRAVPDKNGNYIYDIQQGDEAISVTLTPLEVAFLDTVQKRIPQGDESAPEATPNKIFLPSVGKGMTHLPVEPTDGPPPTATRRPTMIIPTPERTSPTPRATITTEPTPTTVPTKTPTEEPTATATEAGPVKELALNIGDEIIVVDDSYKYALVGKNGDKESGAAAVGYDFEKMENPVRDGNYVVGTVMKDGKPLTIRTPLDLVDPAMRDRIQQGNPDEDSRLRSEVSIWKGSDKPGVDKPVRITANYNGSSGVYGRTFFGNFNTGAQIELSGRASGNAKTGDMVIMSWNQDTRTAETLTFRCNTQGAQWTVLSSTQASSSFAAFLESRKNPDDSTDGLQTEKELYRFPMGQIDLKVQTKDGNLNILDKDGKVIQTIPLSNAMASGLNFVDFGRTGSKNSQAVITVNRAHVSFSRPLEGTPQLSPESRLPTLADLAEANGIRIMAQANATYLSSQPGLLDLYDKTAQLIDTNSAYRDGADLQRFLLDQKRKPAIVLGADISELDLVNIVNEHPGSVFQFVARGTSNGPEGTVVKPDGSLVDKKKLQRLLDAAAANGSKVMLNTATPLDLKLDKATQTDRATSLSPELRLLEDLKTLKNQSALTVLFAGDSKYILDPKLARSDLVSAVQYALKVAQDAGFNVGLANISGPDKEYVSLIGEIASGLKNITLGFGTSLNIETTPVGLFDYTIGPVADFQTVSYSDGEDVLYNALLQSLPDR